MSDAAARVRALPIWSGEIDVEPLSGGLSNESFKVTDGDKAYVVRFGRDFPFHHVFREREAMVAAAAARAGLAPALVHSEPGVSVIDYIDGKTYEAEDVIGDIPRIADLVRRFHEIMPKEVSGPAFMFWPFHMIRDYARTLEAAGSRMVGELPGYLELAEELERAQMPLPIIFGHNDLLPGNLIDDGQRLWLIDFEYGGFSTAMFDLAGSRLQCRLRRRAIRSPAGALLRPATGDGAHSEPRRHAMRLASARGHVEHGLRAPSRGTRRRLCDLHRGKSRSARGRPRRLPIPGSVEHERKR